MFSSFKSQKDFDFNLSNIEIQLNLILREQRHQRSDLATIIRLINVLINDLHLQKQVDDFYETSPQTDQAQDGSHSDNT